MECRLCLTLHVNEGSYLAHTQGKKHQTNLARRAARENKDLELQTQVPQAPTIRKKVFVKIGRPGECIQDPVSVFEASDELTMNLKVIKSSRYANLQINGWVSYSPSHYPRSKLERDHGGGSCRLSSSAACKILRQTMKSSETSQTRLPRSQSLPLRNLNLDRGLRGSLSRRESNLKGREP